MHLDTGSGSINTQVPIHADGLGHPTKALPSENDPHISDIAKKRFAQKTDALTGRLQALSGKVSKLKEKAETAEPLTSILIRIKLCIVNHKLTEVHKALDKHISRTAAAQKRASDTQEVVAMAQEEQKEPPTPPETPQLYASTVAFSEVASRTGKAPGGLAAEVRRDYLAKAHAPEVISEGPSPTHSSVTAPPWKSTAGEWQPRSAVLDSSSETPTVREGEVVPTSARTLGSKDLPNIYVRKPPPPDRRESVITCGAVDSDTKGAELLAVVRQQHPTTPPPLRLSMHQLNSRLSPGEGKLIDREHTQSQRLNTALKEEGGSVAHTNNSVDAFSRFGFHSAKYNPEAYRTYFEWIFEDMNTHLNEATGGVSGAMESMVEKLAHQSDPPLSADEKRLLNLLQRKFNTSDAKGILRTIMNDKKLFTVFMKKMEGLTPGMKNGLSILHKLMTSDVKASQRVLLELAFDREVGAISEMNCKSGLDRTGHIRSLDDAISSLVEEGKLDPTNRPEEYLDFIMNVEKYLGEWNNATKNADSPEAVAHIRDSAPEPQKTRFALCYGLQIRYLDCIQRVALPITAVSTGVAGVKWHQERSNAVKFALSYNKEPMPFLPLFAMKPKTEPPENPPYVRIISQKKGRFLTEEGVRLFQGDSPLRGG